MPMGRVPWNASPYDGVSPWGMLACPFMDMHLLYIVVPQDLAMPFHLPGSPAFEDAFPYGGVSEYMGMYSRLLGHLYI